MENKRRGLTRSQQYLERARVRIPCQTQCLSKGPTQFVQGVAPVYLERGEGSHVWDVDGHEYIDYLSGLGPISLGYNYPATNEAIIRQLEKGTTFSLMHPLELEVADLLADVIPCAEMARFAKNGSDVTSAAVRLARAYTGREHIAQCGYHGWHDWYVVTTERNKGIPRCFAEFVHPFTYDRLESLERIFREHPGGVAAVMMEPVGVAAPSDGYLQRVKDLAHSHGALLIFDEVITGFRWALGGAQEYFGVEPDLACFGKSMANGMPLSALVGRREVMRMLEEVFFSLTFGGECLSLAAGVATITEMRRKRVIEQIWQKGTALQVGFNELCHEYGLEERVKCIGYPVRSVVRFTDQNGSPSLLLKSVFQQEVIKRGVLFAGYHNLSFSHTEADIERTLEVYGAALRRLRAAMEANGLEAALEGTPVENVFRPQAG